MLRRPPPLPSVDLGAAAAAALPVRPALTSRLAQAAATDAGEVITLTAIRSSEKMLAASSLIPLLPPYAVAAMFSTSEARVAAASPLGGSSLVWLASSRRPGSALSKAA